MARALVALAVAVLGLAPMFGAASAWGRPGPPPRGSTGAICLPAGGEPATRGPEMRLSLAELRGEAAVRLFGRTSELAIPLFGDGGVRPDRLDLHWTLAPAAAAVRFVLEANGRVLATARETGAQGHRSIALPPSAAPGSDGELRLRIALEPRPEAGCVPDDRLWIEIDGNSALAYRPGETPAAATTLFPSWLRRLWIAPAGGLERLAATDGARCRFRVPPHAAWDRERARVVLELALRLARHYPAPVDIRLLGPGEELPRHPAPFERLLVLSEEEKAGGRVPDCDRARLLFLGGPELEGMFAQSAELPAPVLERDGSRRLAFAALGYGDREVRSLGTARLRYDFAQSDLGGPVRDLSLAITGTVAAPAPATPVAVDLRVNGHLLARERVSTGALRLQAEVPDRLLRRDNRIDLIFTPSRMRGSCPALEPPLLARVGADSSLRFRPDAPPGDGFEAFPQLFAGEVPVFLGDFSPARLRAAAALLAAMQRTTRWPLRVRLVEAPSDTPLLGVARRVPVAFGWPEPPFLLRDLDGMPLLRVAQGTALLRAREGRLFLSGPARLSERLVARVLARDGWYGLMGDLVFYDGRQDPVGFAVASRRLRIEPAVAAQEPWWRRRRGMIASLGALGLFFLLTRLYPRLVRGREPDV